MLIDAVARCPWNLGRYLLVDASKLRSRNWLTDSTDSPTLGRSLAAVWRMTWEAVYDHCQGRNRRKRYIGDIGIQLSTPLNALR